MNCDVDRRHGLDLALLWLWRRPVATAPIGPLAWELPYVADAALEKTKKKKRKEKKFRTPMFQQVKNLALPLPSAVALVTSVAWI